MANDIHEACEALAVAVGKVDGLRARGYVDDKINPPEAQVFTREFDPRLTLGGSPNRAVALGVRVFVNRQNLKAAQLALRGYMDQTGALSVIEAIENDKYWPADTHYVEVVRVGAPFETDTVDAAFLAVDFDVDVVL